MASNDIEQKFYDILASMLALPRDRLGASSARDSVAEWDSLKHMHLMLALEEEFGIEFSDNELANLGSVGELLRAIGDKAAA